MHYSGKSHRTSHPGSGSTGASVSAKKPKPDISQSLSSVVLKSQGLKVHTADTRGSAVCSSGESAKTSPSTDNSGDVLGPSEMEIYDSGLQPDEQERSSYSKSRTRACSDNPLSAPSGSSYSQDKNHGSNLSRGQQIAQSSEARKIDQRYKQSSKQSNNSGVGAKHRKNSPELAKLKTSLEEAIGHKVTTPYPHKYKTVMCKFYQRTEACPYGDQCNYAHGKSQLNKGSFQNETTTTTVAAQAKTETKNRTFKKSLTLIASPKAEENKIEISTKNRVARNLNFTNSDEPERMNSLQDLSGQEQKNDLQTILPEILVKNQTPKEFQRQISVQEFRGQKLASAQSQADHLTQTPTKRIIKPLYSTMLNDLVDLSLRKAWSELTPGLVSYAEQEDRKIHQVIEQQIEESPGLKQVQRLSVFEDICPSEGVLSEHKTTPSNQFSKSDCKPSAIELCNGPGSPLFKTEKTQENVSKFQDRFENQAGLKLENMEDFPSPQVTLKYQVADDQVSNYDQIPLAKANSMGYASQPSQKTGVKSSKNSRKYQNRRFKPRVEPVSDSQKNLIAGEESIGRRQ